MTARERLAAMQAELVHALLAGGLAPAGFDPQRLRIEAVALHAKRRRVAEQLRPDLADALDDRFTELFDVWARNHPRRSGVPFHTDLEAFEIWLVEHRHLPR